MAKTLRALVLSGDGINCEVETAAAAQDAGFVTNITHVNDFLKAKGASLDTTDLLLIPGGFSFGDELGSGKILALKLKHGLGDTLTRYISRGGAVLGICNGFQVLSRLGVFGPNVVLAQNRQGHFVDQWVRVEITGESIFTATLKRRGVTHLEMPMRHGEGRLLFTDDASANRADKSGEIVLRYDRDVNGAWSRAAALCSHHGRVMGLMPHPEAFWCRELHPAPEQSQSVPLGIEMFQSAYHELSKELTGDKR